MNSGRYDDIMDRQHPAPFRRKRMPADIRAAQFVPFAALTGYEEAVEETARLTETELELDDENLALLNERIHALLEVVRDLPEVTITFFEPDSKKAGGAYTSVTGRIRRIDEVSRQVILADRTVIAMDAICAIDGMG